MSLIKLPDHNIYCHTTLHSSVTSKRWWHHKHLTLTIPLFHVSQLKSLWAIWSINVKVLKGNLILINLLVCQTRPIQIPYHRNFQMPSSQNMSIYYLNLLFSSFINSKCTEWETQPLLIYNVISHMHFQHTHHDKTTSSLVTK